MSFSSYPLGGAFESRRLVANAEHVTVRAVVDVVENAVFLSLPVPTATGLQQLRGTRKTRDHMNEESENQKSCRSCKELYPLHRKESENILLSLIQITIDVQILC